MPLDEAAERADLAMLELGLELGLELRLDPAFRAGGSSGTQTPGFTGREALPWQVCLIRVRSGQAHRR
ncbi:MAG: hypothetical protein WEA77_03890 [Hyphomonas sp.]|uniref:hypothetical protein n=1 Tax=Hyphomonas sp. TaxID=87 RepID=UPI0034A00B69